MKKNIYIISISIAIVLLSYIYMKPMGSGFKEIVDSDYSLTVRDTNSSNYSEFYLREDKKFFIRLGERGSPRAIFKIKDNSTLNLYFSINGNSKLNSINFTIKKSNGESKELKVFKSRLNKVVVDIDSGDTIEIYSNSLSSSVDDWSLLKIDRRDKLYLFESLIIPISWILLFLLLYFWGYIYLYISSYTLFVIVVMAEKLNFGYLSFKVLFTYMVLSFCFVAISIAIYQIFEKIKRYYFATIIISILDFLIYVAPLSFIVYILSFEKIVSKDILYAIFQTNSSESLEFISSFIPYRYVLLYLLIVIFTIALHFTQDKSAKKSIDRVLLTSIIFSLAIVVYINFSLLRLPNFISSELTNYTREVEIFKSMKAKRDSGKIEFNATKVSKGESYIVIIGESLNKNHMGVYGYFRDTTPHLSKMAKDGEIVLFDNVYSNHTSTVPVLRYSLTEANQYNKKNFYESISIVELLKKADIETYWITNQVIYGIWDNMVSIIGTAADHVVSLNKTIGRDTSTQQLDGSLIDEVKKVLSRDSDKDRVIFVHLIGNHFSYLKRYPNDSYSRYSGDLDIGEFGIESYTNIYINSYDNSILYNDFVVTSILKELQKSKKVSAFLYMPDHAEDVIGLRGHNSDKFTFDMTQIPMILWVSDGYKKRYKSKYLNLLNHKDRLFSNDMLYDTMVGIFGVKSDRYDPKFDLSSKEYRLSSDSALVLDGKKHYLDPSNYIYWQKINTKYLIDINQSSRVFPHRVDSIGKLSDIWRDGFRSFEIDIRFGDGGSSIFRVGHNIGMQGGSLEEFLSAADYSKIQRVWFDLKNLNEANYREVLERLEYLDREFQLKSKAILESPTESQIFAKFTQKGWHTSLYLPTTKIVDLIAKKDSVELERLSVEIAREIEYQNISAISFDSRLYSFVKDHLESKIDSSIVYNSWYGVPLYDIDFQNKLKRSKIFMDDRVKTILSKYISHFAL